jgi:hypothetical protein
MMVEHCDLEVGEGVFPSKGVKAQRHPGAIAKRHAQELVGVGTALTAHRKLSRSYTCTERVTGEAIRDHNLCAGTAFVIRVRHILFLSDLGTAGSDRGTIGGVGRSNPGTS